MDNVEPSHLLNHGNGILGILLCGSLLFALPVYFVGLGRTENGFETRAFSSLRGILRSEASVGNRLGMEHTQPF